MLTYADGCRRETRRCSWEMRSAKSRATPRRPSLALKSPQLSSKSSANESVGDMLACWIVGWVVGPDAEMVDVLGDGG